MFDQKSRCTGLQANILIWKFINQNKHSLGFPSSFFFLPSSSVSLLLFFDSISYLIRLMLQSPSRQEKEKEEEEDKRWFGVGKQIRPRLPIWSVQASFDMHGGDSTSRPYVVVRLFYQLMEKKFFHLFFKKMFFASKLIFISEFLIELCLTLCRYYGEKPLMR